MEAVGVNANILGSGTLRTALVKVLGTENFYWQGDAIVMIHPSDNTKLIKIGQYLPDTYGIAVSTDAGATWTPAIDFTGVRGGSGGSTIIYQDTIAKQGLAPTSPSMNDLWVDTILHRLKMWDGTEWVVIGYEPPEDPTPEEPDDPGDEGGESGGDDGEGGGEGGESGGDEGGGESGGESGEEETGGDPEEGGDEP